MILVRQIGLVNSLLSERKSMIEITENTDAFLLWCDSLRRTPIKPPFRIACCLESFPRSANSYTVASLHPLLKDQGLLDGMNVFIHHTHRVETLEFSLSSEAPTVAIIREPLEAIASSYIFYNRRRSLERLIRQYLDFYTPILTKDVFRDRRFILLNFSAVTKNINSAIERLNERYEWELRTLKDIDQHKMKVFNQALKRASENADEEEIMRTVGVPRVAREEEKIEIKSDLRKLNGYLAAESVYQEIIGWSAAKNKK